LTKQLSLFGDEPEPVSPSDTRKARLDPAPPQPQVVELGRVLPEGVYLGTSSWTFPGWEGLIYQGSVTKPRLSKQGLAAYARYPVFGTVGVDRTYYAPVGEDLYREWAEAVPDTFKFLVKAHDWCTLPTFPDHARHGARRGKPNDFFLDTEYAIETMLLPMLEGLGDKAGPLVFQFSPLRLGTAARRGKFIEMLHRFLSALPTAGIIAIEIRNRELLCDEYASALSDTGASHCFNIHTSMPGIAEQLDIVGNQPCTVVRWMLGHGQRYQDAVERYQPFDRLVDEDPTSRKAVAAMVRESVARQIPAFVTVNNKAEGSSPQSIIKLAEEVTRPTDSE
jgi:uncharacterized protein YecE (DUF72 family)